MQSNLVTFPAPQLFAAATDVISLDERIRRFPELRYMGSKRRLLPWIREVLATLDFETALDPFSGSNAVAYLLKAMGRRTIATDFLNFPATIAAALIENNTVHLDGQAMRILLAPHSKTQCFIEETFSGVFYTREDLQFLDRLSGNLRRLDNPLQQALAMAALIRSCVKRQPRGVFTISGDLSKYDDGRRDLRLSIEEHFFEQVEAFNEAVFSNGRRNRAGRSDVFKVGTRGVDLVYLDPPYVPRADDNCYVKRYHFLEGLSCYWHGLEIDYSTKVRKIRKAFTPFSYRGQALEAFDRLFKRFSKQKIVLSYSSNGFPSLDQIESLLRRTKNDVRVFTTDHRYHFGTHEKVKRAAVVEYLIIGE